MNAFVQHSLIKPGTVEKRLYQEVIVARALEQGNTLVVAPTALGKTIIALLLSVHVLEKQEKGKVLFLSPTRPLALQHSESFKKFLNIQEQDITLLDGHVEKEKRKQEWEKAKIVCATPQTIENDIITSNISMLDCSLCIFDECHRAVGNYSYVFIAKELQKNLKKPLVLALTASPGATQEKILEVCQNLFIKNIEIKTQADADVAPYTKETETEWRTTFLPESFLEIRRHFDYFMKENLEALKKIGVAKTANIKFYNKTRLLEMQSQLRKRLSQHAGRQPYLFQAATKCAMLMKVSHAVTLLETQGINALVSYLEKMHKKSFHSGATKALKQMFANQQIQFAFNLVRQLKEKGIDHPKKELLKKAILMELKSNPDSRIIVFNHYRDSIKSLVVFLNEIEGIRAERFVGQAAKENEKGMSQKQQAKIIQEFREGKFNTIVCSSVAEEGLDIPTVDLVIFFEPVPSEIRTIQRRGRTGRIEKGKVIILMAKGTRDEAFYWSSLSKEKTMHSTLKEMKKELLIKPEKMLEKQATLLSYSGQQEEVVNIFADTREQASPVVKELREIGCSIHVKQLEVGDYIITDSIVVERKTVKDFLDSIVDGRLFQQLVSLSTNYSSPLILVEGNISEMFSLREIHRNAIIGALTSIATAYRVPVLFTQDARETAEYLFVIGKREQLGKEKDIRLRVGRKGLALEEQQQFIVESLPLIGPSMAKKLLKKFGSVEKVFTATEKQLQKIEGMGEKKARLVRKTVSAKFEQKDCQEQPNELGGM